MDPKFIYDKLSKDFQRKQQASAQIKERTDWLITSWDTFKLKIDEIKDWITQNRPLLQSLNQDLDTIKSAFDELKDKALDIVDKVWEDFLKGDKND